MALSEPQGADADDQERGGFRGRDRGSDRAGGPGGVTRELPKTLRGQIGHLILQLGSARAYAPEIRVTADSVNCYRRGARKHARPDVDARIDVEHSRWQTGVRKRRQDQVATAGGTTAATRAPFGYTAPIGTTDDGGFRRLTVHPPAYAQCLFQARVAGDQEMRGIFADGCKDEAGPRHRPRRPWARPTRGVADVVVAARYWRPLQSALAQRA
ncbi:telomere-protecting terminal protein Tpg [Streptomyces chartreusis]|uniref:telomere-protecting terminal protein Tpg n=1 Tax=Streptomyces chartreusis TaxID=1969 RepID=UPI00386BC312